jgi:hypothetical protein
VIDIPKKHLMAPFVKEQGKNKHVAMSTLKKTQPYSKDYLTFFFMI